MQLDPNKLVGRSCSMQLAPAATAALAAIVRLPLGEAMELRQAPQEHQEGTAEAADKEKDGATGSFNKNVSKSPDVLTFQYGDSLTDRDALDVPVPSRNVKTAPSTPEAESRAFPRHAESTSQLEMSAAHKKHHKHSPDGHSGQKSPHKEVSPKMNKSRNEKFHKLFKIIPGDEVLLNAYSCAYFGDILLQGNLYISPNWFCFHSRILGHEKLIEIHVTKVVNVTREKTAFIIPNAIGIRTADDKFVFGSLMSRDSTYKLMVNVWKQARAGEMLDITKDTGDEDVSDNNGCIDDPSNENNNEVLKAPPGVVDVSEVSSDSESDADPCIPEHSPKPRTVNYHSADEQRAKEKKVKDYIPYSILSRPISAASQLVSKATSMPRTSLLLAVCGVLVLLLMLSAVVMTYKIMVLQARLDSNPGWSESPKSSVSGDTLYRDVYFLNNQYHTATVERFHSVVRANIELLGQVHNSLKSLQSSPLAQDKGCLKDEDTGSRTDDTKTGDT